MSSASENSSVVVTQNSAGNSQGFKETESGEVDGSGHYFFKRAFHKLVYCSQCGEMIWGFLRQGYICDVCNFLVHEKCLRLVNVPCVTLAPILVEKPVAHVWTDVEHSARRRFCNVCRKHLHDESSLRCEVCEYYVHQECLNFAVNCCKQSATFRRDEQNVKSFLQSLLSEEERNFLKPFDFDRSYTHFRSGSSTPNRSRSASSTPSPGASPTRTRSPSSGQVQTAKPSTSETQPLAGTGTGTHTRQGQGQGQGQGQNFVMQCHHFTEQVPTHSAKCRVCRKAIFSDCLNSLKCEWCQTTIHSGCIGPIQHTVCDFGSLANLILPPAAVELPQSDADQHNSSSSSSSSQYQRSTARATTDMRSIEENWEQRIQSEREREKETKEQKDKEEDHIRVYDGNEGIRNLQYRSIFVPKTALTSEVLEIALRQFHISGDFGRQLYLSELPEKESQKRRLEDILPFRLQLRGDVENPSVVLRDSESTGESTSACVTTSVRVYFDTAISSFVRMMQRREKDRERGGMMGDLVLMTRQVPVPGSFAGHQSLTASPHLSVGNAGLQQKTPQKPPLTMEVPLYRLILVGRETRARDLMHSALQKLGSHKLVQLFERPASFANAELACKEAPFSLRITDQSGGSLQERFLAPDELILPIVKQIRKESIYRFYTLRFTVIFSRFACSSQQQHCNGNDSEVDHAERISLASEVSSGIPLFVSNLKNDLSQRQYERILLEKLGPENKWSAIDVIYYEYGALVLLFPSVAKATRALNILKASQVDDKTLLALLLPYIHTELLPPNCELLVAFVNTKSGGYQGTELLQSLRSVLNPHQVMNLEYGGPLPGLYLFRNVKQYKIMVCGGDGSVSWVLSCLDNVGQDAQCQSPPISIVPLGTGNDLARVMNWGSGYSSNEDLLSTLADVVNSEKVRLDRWTVIFYCAPDKERDRDRERDRSVEPFIEQPPLFDPVLPPHIGDSVGGGELAAVGAEDSCEIVVMNNYFGVGIDADLCLGFHLEREEHPDRFNSRFYNKGVYVKIGLRKIVTSDRRSCKDLHRMVRAELDGRPLELPPCEGLILLNISSWGSGANLWGSEREDEHVKPAYDDGLFEIVTISGVVHMGQIQSGLRSGTRVAQGSRLKLLLLADLPVQVDGEPWVQPPSQIVISRSALTATMLRKVKSVPSANANKSKRPAASAVGLGPCTGPSPCSSGTQKQHPVVPHQHSAAAIDTQAIQERTPCLRVGRSLDEVTPLSNQDGAKS